MNNSDSRYFVLHLITLIVLTIVLPVSSFGQNNNISLAGKIYDGKTGVALPGATVHIKGTTHEVITDKTGEFRFITGQRPPLTLIVSYVGYKTREDEVNGTGFITIDLQEANTQLSDVVVVGYGTQTRRSLASSIAKVDAEETRQIPVAGFDAQLQGKAAGLQVNSQSGTPGEGIRIRVRGSTSIYAGNDPLYIVDGVFVNSSTLSNPDATTADGKAGPVNLGEKATSPLADINPSDIENIEVLKDAEATAIYGSRGANGVIIVTTKHSGFGAKSKIIFNTAVGVAAVQKSRLWKVATGPQDAIIANEQWINSGIDEPGLNQNASNELFQRLPNGQFNSQDQSPTNPDRGNPSDQGTYSGVRLNEVFRNALLQNTDLAVEGGSSNSKYYIGGSYSTQEATIRPAGFSRASVKTNYDVRLNDWVSFGVSNLISRTHRTQLRDGNGPEAGIFQSALQTPSYLPTTLPSGAPARWANFDNTEVLVSNPAQWTNSLRDIGNLYLDAQITPQIKFHSTVGIDYDNYNEIEYYNTNTLIGSTYNGEAKNNIIQLTGWVNEQTLTYKTNFSQRDHFGILIGNTLMGNVFTADYTAGTGFPSNAYTLISAAANQVASQDAWKNSLASFFTRVNYDLGEKYYIEATARADGSSKFGAANRWGYFPAIGGAWRIKEEEFLKHVSAINNLKIRGSYGITGNQNGINNYASQGLWTGSAGYPNSPTGQSQPGTQPLQLANPNLKWESTAQADIGIDLGLVKGRIEVVLDLYSKHTKNALVNLPVPSSTGFSSQFANAAEISNKGYEIGVNTINVETRDFKWVTNFNISGNVNKILRLATPITFYSRNWLIDAQGHAMYSFWLYKQLYVDPATGNSVYQTANGKTSYSGTYSPNITLTTADRVIMGNAMPDFFGGITNNVSYKGFDLSIFFSYQYGSNILNYNRFLGEKQGQAGYDGRFVIESQMDRWTHPGQITSVPRVTSVGNNYLIEQNSRFLENGSFLRLKTLSIGYSLNKLSTKLKVEKIRVYVLGSNLWLLTKYTGPDPEISVNQGNGGNAPGLDQGTPPQPRSLQAGINITL
ncbi:MAG TPA: SusC/RagA family TonB-linked outer membrane protein [Puia sp.]|nr:SusC/RagA family TonB-linked outer membrane protein [Puia sp.]